MAEQLQNLTLSDNQLAEAQLIADEALITVEARYGTGFPHFVGGGEANLAYHAGYHTEAVAHDALDVGRELGFSVPELATAYVAGRAHDIVQLKPRGVMERESTDWLVEQMRRRGQPAVMAEAGALAILGTEPIIEGNRLVGQRVTELDYPSKSAARVAGSVACGDFGDLYGPKGPYLSHKLWQEIKGVDPNQNPPLEGFEEYLQGQIALRETYRFPLKVADKLLATHRRQVMKYGEQVLKQVRRGDITSWQQLEAQDLAFMRQHS